MKIMVQYIILYGLLVDYKVHERVTCLRG